MLRGALAQIEALRNDPRRFAVYRDDPVGFCHEVLGIPLLVIGETPAGDVLGLWWKQVEILEAMVRYQRICVPSGHGIGKTFILAVAVLWWVFARCGVVVTTASTWRQVEKGMWREIHERFRKAVVPLPGTLLNVELKVEGEDMMAFGLSVDEPEAFHGIHHPDLLVVVDEAPGVSDAVHQAISSLACGEKNVIVGIGNPLEPIGEFYEYCQSPMWHQIQVDCHEHPNVVCGREVIPGAVTLGWIAWMTERWGVDSPVFQGRVLGQFPTAGARQLINPADVAVAMQLETMERLQAESKREEIIFGVDVARFGDNKTVVAIRQGKVIRDLIPFTHLRTTEVFRAVRDLAAELSPTLIVVDEPGVGGGVIDLLYEAKIADVVSMNSGRPARDKTLFNNRRSEMWWTTRELLQRGQIALPRIEQLKKDLVAPKYKYVAGRIRVETKDELEARGVDSSDYADAVMMAFAIEGHEVPEDLPPIELNKDPNEIIVVDVEFEGEDVVRHAFGDPDPTWSEYN